MLRPRHPSELSQRDVDLAPGGGGGGGRESDGDDAAEGAQVGGLHGSQVGAYFLLYETENLSELESTIF